MFRPLLLLLQCFSALQPPHRSAGLTSGCWCRYAGLVRANFSTHPLFFHPALSAVTAINAGVVASYRNRLVYLLGFYWTDNASLIQAAGEIVAEQHPAVPHAAEHSEHNPHSARSAHSPHSPHGTHAESEEGRCADAELEPGVSRSNKKKLRNWSQLLAVAVHAETHRRLRMPVVVAALSPAPPDAAARLDIVKLRAVYRQFWSSHAGGCGGGASQCDAKGGAKEQGGGVGEGAMEVEALQSGKRQRKPTVTFEL